MRNNPPLITRVRSQIVANVPLAPSLLGPLLAAGIPHKLRDRGTQCAYLRALFAFAGAPGAAPLREGLLAAAVDHLLAVDVEIKWQEIADRPGACCMLFRIVTPPSPNSDSPPAEAAHLPSSEVGIKWQKIAGRPCPLHARPDTA